MNTDHRVYIGEVDGISELSADKTSVVSVIGEGGSMGYEEGSGHEAQFRGVSAITVHEPRQSLFVCDTGNDVIREVTVHAGVGTSSMFVVMMCRVLAFDSSFELLYVGSSNGVIRIAMADKSLELYMDSSAGVCL